jgi:hypothetical protein
VDGGLAFPQRRFCIRTGLALALGLWWIQRRTFRLPIRSCPDFALLWTLADYANGADAVVPVQEAINAIETATLFVGRIAELLAKT